MNPAANAATDNVIQFPKTGVVREQPDLETIHSRADDNKRDYINDIATDIATFVFMKISMAGFDVNDVKLMKDDLLIWESIKSIMLKSVGLEHPLQKLAQQVVSLSDDVAQLLLPGPDDEEVDGEYEE